MEAFRDGAIRDFKEAFGGPILNDNPVMIVRQDNRIAHGLHDGLQLGDGHVHVRHPVVVVLDLEESREIAIRHLDQIAKGHQFWCAFCGKLNPN